MLLICIYIRVTMWVWPSRPAKKTRSRSRY